MKATTRGAFSLVELLTVIAIIALLISILMPALNKSREMARRTVCLANQRSIIQGCIAYASGTNCHFPYWSPSVDPSNKTGTSFSVQGNLPDPGFSQVGAGWDWDGVLGHSGDPGQAKRFSNSRNLWLLIRGQAGDAKTFVCPSDGDAGQPFEPAEMRAIYDVQNRSQFSFAFQYQGPIFTKPDAVGSGWNTSTRDDPKLVILADSSPWMHAKNPNAVLHGDTFGFYLASSDPTNIDFPTGFQFVDYLSKMTDIRYDPTTARAVYSITSDALKSLNSSNHRGEGQNVARLDGSASWAENPWAGAYLDNIWTPQSPAAYVQQDYSKFLQGRMLGVYDTKYIDEKGILSSIWLASGQSIAQYPDSFLVP